jgi:uncharacterized MAPEG superfamily protein
MTPDLRLLLWTVALTFVQLLGAVLGANSQVGLLQLVGNREPAPVLAGWAGRAERAHRNMLESLPLFIALVLIAHIAGKTDATTLLGAELFFWARLVHWLVYLAGIPWLRTGAWAVSFAGLILIFARLL